MRTVFAFVLLFVFSLSFAQNERLIPALGALERGDVRQAIDSLKPLAATGDIEAQYTLATVLENAKPPLQDLEQGVGGGVGEQGHRASQAVPGEPGAPAGAPS